MAWLGRVATGVYLLVVATVTLGVTSDPSHHHRWYRHCSSPESPDTAQSRGTRHRFSTILTLTEEARNSTDGLILRYLKERFHSSTYPDMFADLIILGIPQVGHRDMSKITVNASVDESRLWVAKCMLFVEQTRHNEATEEDEYGHSFYSDTEKLVHDYHKLFCSLNSTLQSLGIKPVSSLASAENTADKYRVAESVAVRQLRDYLVLRDCLKMLAETSRTFRVLRRRIHHHGPTDTVHRANTRLGKHVKITSFN